jgi:hypothetical protein
MNDLWVRVALVAGALAVAAVITLIARRRASRKVRIVRAGGLDSGVYFFSASTCASCEQARVELDSSVGVAGYTEFAWERHPEIFSEYGVEQVPAVMVVDDAGRGRLYPGQPGGALV